MHVDQAGAMLWTGHADGRVSGFWLGGAPGSAINNCRKFHWQVCMYTACDSVSQLEIERIVSLCMNAFTSGSSP